MSATEIADLRRRVKHQRQELKKLNRHVAMLNQRVMIAGHNQHEATRRYQELLSRKYKTRWYRLWVWWRNGIRWRAVSLLPWNRKVRSSLFYNRYWYNRGRDEAIAYFGACSFPEPKKPLKLW